MASLKQRLRERLDSYLNPGVRDRVVADVLDALDRPTLLMVDEGARVLDDVTFDQRRGHQIGDRDLVATIFSRMVDAGRNGA